VERELENDTKSSGKFLHVSTKSSMQFCTPLDLKCFVGDNFRIFVIIYVEIPTARTSYGLMECGQLCVWTKQCW
jgi:hypothetical protein